MEEITYNQPSSYIPPADPTQIPGSTVVQQPINPSAQNKLVILGLIVFIVLLIIFSLYFAFARPQTKSISHEELMKTLPGTMPLNTSQ